MKAAVAIAHREWCSYFRTPIGWVVIALYLLLSGAWVSLETIRPGEPATMRVFFAVSQWLLLAVAPAISMRLLSEELRAGTIEPLMASPLSDWAIVAGKYLGAVLFLLTMLAPTLVYVAVLESVADPDPGPILAGYLGLLLVGLLYLAVGLLFSSLTQNQVVAYLGALFLFLLLWFVTSQGARLVGPPLDARLYAMSIQLRIADFAKGVIEAGNIAFFLSASAWFVVISVVVVESRRWR